MRGVEVFRKPPPFSTETRKLQIFKDKKVLIMATFVVTKDSIISDVLEHDIGIARYFLEIGMHCIGCPASKGETIEQACAVHRADPDELIEKINEYLSTK